MGLETFSLLGAAVGVADVDGDSVDEVLSHPNPELLGEQIEVRLPRELVVLMVSRDFYNETIHEGAFPIDETIFTHTEGDPWSYPTSADRDRLLTTYPGLSSEAQEVGQGGGQRIVSITEFESTTEGTPYGFEADLRGPQLRGRSVGGIAGEPRLWSSEEWDLRSHNLVLV